jgi:hypothetical protein
MSNSVKSFEMAGSYPSAELHPFTWEPPIFRLGVSATPFASVRPPALQRRRLSPGALTPRAVLEKFACIQMLDVHLPTTDGREIVLSL